MTDTCDDKIFRLLNKCEKSIIILFKKSFYLYIQSFSIVRSATLKNSKLNGTVNTVVTK